MKIISRYFPYALAALIGLLALSSGAFAQTQTATTTLQDLIKEKSAALEQIQQQRAEVQKTLDSINDTHRALSTEINYMDKNISQLNLLMKANQLSAEKLGLEVESIAQDMQQIEAEIQNKKKTIGKLFAEMQQKDNESLLTLFLRNQSLSESIGEIQTLNALNNNLVTSIDDLKNLQTTLSTKATDETQKKKQKEVEQISIKNQQYILQDQKSEKAVLLAETKSKEDVYQAQLDELTKQQNAISKEIESVESVLRANIDPNLLPLPRPSVLLWPVPGGVMTQGYGRTSFAIKTYGSQYHNGVDIGAPLGTKILAAAEGTVINTGNQDKYCPHGAYGKFVVIKHTNGLTTLYGHMSRTIVTIGQHVDAGELIGFVGRTGWATGPHLHFTVFASNTLTPAHGSYPEGTSPSRTCGPMPVGGDLDPTLYL